MSQAAIPRRTPALAITPQTLSPQEQLDALRRVQAQAEQRVNLGVQFFKAAEARTDQFREMIEKIKGEQDQLREDLRNDMVRSLRGYDQWLGEIDQDLTAAIGTLEDRVNKLQQEWAQAQEKINALVGRSEAMFEQSRLLNEARTQPPPGRAVASVTAEPSPEPTPAPQIIDQLTIPAPHATVEASTLDSAATALSPKAAAKVETAPAAVSTVVTTEITPEVVPEEPGVAPMPQFYSRVLAHLRERANEERA